MKIYFLGADYPPTGGGIATYSYEWIQAVSKNPNIESIEALIFGNNDPRTEDINDNTKVKTLKKISFLYVGMKVFQVFWRSRSYDIFHSLNLFPIGFWVSLWGKFFRKKTIVTFYGTDANDTSASSKTFFLKKWTLKHISRSLTISDFTKKETENRYSLRDNMIKVIYPIVPKVLISKSKENTDMNDLKNKYDIGDNTFVIVSVSRLVKRKGIEFLVRAIDKLKSKNIKLLVIGDGSERENITKLVNDLDLSKKVSVLGKVKDTSVFYSMADVVTLVSYNIENDGDFEGLGLVLLEAQSYGVPVIGSRSGGIPEAFANGTTGLLVEPRDVKSLSDAISRLIDDKDFHNKLSKNTQAFLEERFGSRNTIDRYIELCNGL